ncbi:MAG: GNAT family N-acetyltransferase [Vicinamibacterales bacterium]
MTQRMEQYISRLDSSRFGFTVAKIREVTDDTADLIAAMKAAGVELVIARLPAADVAGLNRLEDLGFRIKDLQVTHRFDLARFAPAHVPAAGLAVRDFDAGDVDQIVDLAARSFSGYGHYAADQRLDRGLCRDGYADWARRSCEDSSVADKVIVAVDDRTVHGFLTLQISESGGHRYAAGGLGAVAPEHRGNGAFSAVVAHGLEWGAALGLAWEEHNALATNYPVHRVFAGLGFRIADASATLHAWL